MSNSRWWEPRNPHTFVEYPWLHVDAIAKLESIIKRTWTIVEQGAGGSTLWFAKRCKRVVTVEHSVEWYEAVLARSPKNVEMIHSTDMPAELPLCNLLFVDGCHPQRADYIYSAKQIVKPGGWVVFDNSNRPEYSEAREWLSSACGGAVEVVDRNKKFSKYFVTDFYRMPKEQNEQAEDEAE